GNLAFFFVVETSELHPPRSRSALLAAAIVFVGVTLVVGGLDAGRRQAVQSSAEVERSAATARIIQRSAPVEPVPVAATTGPAPSMPPPGRATAPGPVSSPRAPISVALLPATSRPAPPPPA